MKRKIYILCLGLMGFATLSDAQGTLKAPPFGGNKKAMVKERIGITDVSVQYDRPGVKGREGHIYGTPVVHRNFTDLSGAYGTSKAAPWRAGANENTIIEFSTPVKIEGQDLEAGKYGFFVAYDSLECTLIFSKNYTSWGSFFYDDKEDALRVKVKPVKLKSSVEWLKYEFLDETENSATLALEWEKLCIPFKIEVDLIKTELADFREELRGDKGFNWDSWWQAASFCARYNTNLAEGLTWAQQAVQNQKNFQTLSAQSQLADKLGKKSLADSSMKAALAIGTVLDVHQYGRQLIAAGKKAEALEVFKWNAQKNPKLFVTYAGLARGYSATGDYKTALSNAKLALPMASDKVNKDSVQEMIRKLEAGKDIN